MLYQNKLLYMVKKYKLKKDKFNFENFNRNFNQNYSCNYSFTLA